VRSAALRMLCLLAWLEAQSESVAGCATVVVLLQKGLEGEWLFPGAKQCPGVMPCICKEGTVEAIQSGLCKRTSSLLYLRLRRATDKTMHIYMS